MLPGLACVVATLVIGIGFRPAAMRGLAADADIARAGVTFIRWSLPGLALQFGLTVVVSVLRGAGIAKPGTVVQVATVGLNILLAPILIAGWGTHHPLDVLHPVGGQRVRAGGGEPRAGAAADGTAPRPGGQARFGDGR